ncbi:MAG: RNA 2',3'-cyclic phosphodiesterase [Phycisphaerae bacterium]
MIRSFVAIALNTQARRAIDRVQSSLKAEVRSVRWVHPELFHLTLKFLGEIEDGWVVDASKAIDQVARNFSPFTLRVSGTGCYPPRGPVRVIWAGIEEDQGQLMNLVDAVEASMEEAGFERERRSFSAHITMGRIRDDRSRGELRQKVEGATLKPVDVEVNELILMASNLSSSGPSYTPMSTLPLLG